MLIYDAALGVPWIVRGPGVVRGLRVAAPATGVDLLPTTLDLLDVDPAPPPLEGDGRSWAAILGGGRRCGAGERPLYSETLAPFLSYGWAPLHSRAARPMEAHRRAVARALRHRERPG